MANLAGSSYSVSISLDYLICGFDGYNDGISNFIKEILKSLQSFEVSPEYFEMKKAQTIRQYENQSKHEPY